MWYSCMLNHNIFHVALRKMLHLSNLLTHSSYQNISFFIYNSWWLENFFFNLAWNHDIFHAALRKMSNLSNFLTHIHPIKISPFSFIIFDDWKLFLPSTTGLIHLLKHPLEQHLRLLWQSSSLEHWSMTCLGQSCDGLTAGHEASLTSKNRVFIIP